MSANTNLGVYKRAGLSVGGVIILLLSAYTMGWMTTSEKYGFLTLVLILGLCGAFFILRRPLVGFALMFFLVPLGPLKRVIQGEVLSDTITLTLALGVLLLGIYGTRVLILHEKVKFDRVSQFACLFVGWAVVTSIWAPNPKLSLVYAFQLSQIIALYVLILNYCCNRQQLNILTLSYVAGATFAATMAIKGSLLTKTGRLTLIEGFSPNTFGRMLGVGMILMLYYSYKTKHKLLKVLLISGIIAVGYSIIGTQSRGVWIAILCSLPISAVLLYGNSKLVKYAIKIIILLIGVVISAYYFGVINEAVVSRFETFLSGDPRTMTSGRTDIWKVGLEVVKDNPLLGVGFGNYKVVYLNYVDAADIIGAREDVLEKGRGAHNVFLAVLSETGLVGSILFISIFIYLFKDIRRITDPMTRLMQMWLFSFIVLVALSGNDYFELWFWFALSLAALEASLGRQINQKVFSR